jgi:uncharacterized damage-inducible protein DinB
MNLYEPKHLADSMRVVRKNTIAIAEDIPEAQYDYRPTQDSRSVRETLLHMASMTLFDLHIHEEQKRTSMEGFEFVTRGGAGPGDKSRFEMLIGSKEHEIHHRAQLMVIERLLGIVPHLTRNRQRPQESAQRSTT